MTQAIHDRPTGLSPDMLSKLDKAYLEYERLNKLVRTVDDRIVKSIKRQKSYCCLVGGPSQVGKSSLIKKVMVPYPRQADARQVAWNSKTSASCDFIPVLAITMPWKPTVETLVQEMLITIGDPNPEQGARPAREARLKRYLQACGTRAMIIDETQRAVDRDGKLEKVGIGFFLQDLYDRLGVVLLLFGLGRSRYLMAQDSQVNNRFSDNRRLEPFRWGDPAIASGKLPDRSKFMSIAKTLCQAVGIESSTAFDLDSEHDLFRLYYASRGAIGYLKKLLHQAFDIVVENGGPIDMPVLADAWTRAFANTQDFEQMSNPFVETFDRSLPPPLPDDDKLVHLSREAARNLGSAALSRTPSKRKVGKALRQAKITDGLTLS